MNGTKIKDLVISIVSYNSLNFLKECLSSIVTNPPDVEYGIIVVDNASSDESVEFVKRNFPQIRLMYDYKKGCSPEYRAS